jgi:type II secretory pathway pseudopilin PulG
MRNQRGVTLVEVMVLLVMAAGAAAAVVAGCDGDKEDGQDDRGYLETVLDSTEIAKQKAACANNGRQLAQALMMYETRTGEIPNFGADGWDLSKDPQPGRTLASDNRDCNLQPWYLLIKQRLVSPDTFRCPSDPDHVYPSGRDGFDSWHNSSYAQAPTSRAYGSLSLGRMPRGRVIWGDRPKEGDLQAGTANHTNRNFSGGNFVSVDGSVRWRESNVIRGDNVFVLEDRDETIEDSYLIWSTVNNPPK